MKLEDITVIYELIAAGTSDVLTRKKSLILRKQAFASISTDPMVKLAFDTRRIDQELQFNPRRGLQNYNRSEKFITEAATVRIKNFKKLKVVLDDIKAQYERDPNWQDSYSRVLLNTLDGTLRVNQKDGDFSDSQPSMGSFSYLEELLDVRYRLTPESIEKNSSTDLRNVILSKDEALINKEASDLVEVKRSDVGKESYDTLLERLFGGVRATKDNPEVERTVTITIKDKFVPEK